MTACLLPCLPSQVPCQLYTGSAIYQDPTLLLLLLLHPGMLLLLLLNLLLVLLLLLLPLPRAPLLPLT